MSDTNLRPRLWPLVVVFLVLFAVTIAVGIKQFINDQNLFAVLILATAGVGLLLYLPQISVAFRPKSFSDDVSDIKSKVGDQQTKLGKLTDEIASVQAKLGAAGVADIQKKLDDLLLKQKTLEPTVAAVSDLQIKIGSKDLAESFSEIKSLLEYRLPPGSTAADIKDLQVKVAGVSTRLDEIATRVPKPAG